MDEKNTAGLTSGTGVDTSDLTAHDKKNGKEAQPYNSDSANEWYYKKQEAEMNHRYALDAWERENEYNTPEAISARLRAAGINPRVAFGNGSGTGGTIEAGSASGSYGRSDATQSAERASAYGGLAINAASEITNTVSGLVGVGADVRYKNEQTKGLAIDNKTKEQKNLNDLNKQVAEIDKLLADTNVSKEQRENLVKQREFTSQQIAESQQNIRSSQQGVEESKQRINESDARIRKMQIEGDVLRAELSLVKDKQLNIQLDNALKEAMKGHYGALKQQAEKEAEFIAARTDLTKTEKRALINRTILDFGRFQQETEKLRHQKEVDKETLELHWSEFRRKCWTEWY